MKIYLLLICFLFVVSISANSCQQVGTNDIATLSLCKFITPAPRLQWSINVTLKQDYEWKAVDDIKYIYLTADEQPIEQTCYQGQTMKGKYSKGTNLMIDHLCFGFKPAITDGAKLYLMVFWNQGSTTSRMVIYLSLTSNGEIESAEVVEDMKQEIIELSRKNLITE